MSEVEELLRRVESHKGVIGVVIINSSGIPIRTTLDNTRTQLYAGLVSQLSINARTAVKTLDPTNDLNFLRIRTTKDEIMIAPDKDYTLIVIQNPSAKE
ncbi:dynein light chain roadblock-type 2 [Pelomyxa schiedti]|nr:dynein light chain roadblock-type 2 [Pelomyxa schiedti]